MHNIDCHYWLPVSVETWMHNRCGYTSSLFPSYISLMCGSRKYPYPPPPWKTIGNSEGEGGFKGSNFRGVWGVHGKLFSKGWQTMYKTLKATYNSSEAQKHTYVRCFEKKSVLLATDMRLTSLALMFLFFFELASATISRRTMYLWNEVENNWKWRT